MLAIVASAPDAETGVVRAVVSRTDGGAGEVSVTYRTADDGATAGTDYEAAEGTLTWADGELGDKVIEVSVLEDMMIEGPEGLTITLSDPTGDAVLGTSAARAEIADDDRIGSAVVLIADADGQQILSYDLDSAAAATSAAVITGTSAPLVDLDVRPANGSIVALATDGTLYTINAATGVATLKATLTADAADTSSPYTALSGARFGIDFNPVPDRLRVVSDTGQNLRINVDTGATTTDTAISGAAGGYPAVAYTNSFGAACRTTLFGIDASTDKLVVQDPPNDGVATSVGSLGFDVTAVRGFDVTSDLNAASSAFALLEISGGTGLYRIDLSTGAATNGAALALPNGASVLGLSMAAQGGVVTQAPGELFAVSDTGTITSFNRSAPTKACTSAAITGLSPGDSPVDLDFRPSTRALHVLAVNGTTGRLYAVDPITGAATGGVTLSAPLSGNAFAMDFNPTGPVALRIVSDTGQNLRVTDVATGTTAVDTSLSGASSGAAGVGYTDSFAGTGTTTLFVVDTAADRLRIQNPPNAGVTIDVGAFGADIARAGFDIDGRDNVGFIAATATGGTSSTLHTINLATGALSASLGAIAGGSPIRGITRALPTTTVFAIDSANNLLAISLADPTTPTLIGAISGLGGETLIGIDVRPSTGVLHGIGSLGGVFAIDLTTAAATKLGVLAADGADGTSPFSALSGSGFGFDFNPTGPVALRIVSDLEQNLRIPNVATGLVTTDSLLSRSARSYAATSVAYSNNVPGATATGLYALDDVNDRLVAIAAPNSGTVREIGALGIDVGTASNFEIISTDTAIAVVRSATDKQVVSINLATGAASPIGSLAMIGEIVGVAAPASSAAPAPDSPVFAVSSTGILITFPRNAPTNLSTVGAISGLGAGETVVDIDVRPSTGELWLLTRSPLGAASLYTVDLATAAATPKSTLSADATDTTSPFTGLALDARYAIDFNPTGPVALRILGDNGDNLRVGNPLAGNTFTDGSIGTPAPDVVGAAYTNSFPGATTTTLFAIDAATGSLQVQSPPNDGVLTPVGALSASTTFAGTGGIAGDAAFDIAGGNNGLALVAVQRTTGTPAAAEAFSRLFRINLATGATTELGSGISGSPIRGLAIRVR